MLRLNVPHSVDNTRLEQWAERDRQRLALYSQYDTLLIEWWDDAVTQAIDDGFLELPRRLPEEKQRLHISAFRYYIENVYPTTGVSYFPEEEVQQEDEFDER